MGIPIAFFTDGLHVDYHRVTDSAEKIDYDKLEAVTKTVYAVGWVLGNSATRPKLNDEAARPTGQRHEDGEGPGLGQADAHQVARLKFWRPPTETL